MVLEIVSLILSGILSLIPKIHIFNVEHNIPNTTKKIPNTEFYECKALLTWFDNKILMLRDNKILMLYNTVIVTLFVVLPYVTKIHEPPPPKRNKR
jgi:hypothetical protein